MGRDEEPLAQPRIPRVGEIGLDEDGKIALWEWSFDCGGRPAIEITTSGDALRVGGHTMREILRASIEDDRALKRPLGH